MPQNTMWTHQNSQIQNKGGHSDPGGRQKTVPRSKDCCGHSGFLTGLAGDRQKAACQPIGKQPSMRMPAPNGAGGVEDVRRVQWHPSRISVSAMQTLKYKVGPSYGGPCSAHAMLLAWALQGLPGASRHPSPPSCSWRAEPPGTGWR
ncbi:hypothetical protein NDU88_005161 [Pleurodeles waltl]|uniref:Uncharacterized protein n=1 Tax=Pleurodeles waltl TaxID=8319 RepID=A0AAV7LLX0_PLEWA|nr:hypothetical protein NDU88_005161 [Pleurodeles waltl]